MTSSESRAQEGKARQVLQFRPRAPHHIERPTGRGLDICDHCHHSAYIDEGIGRVYTRPDGESGFRWTCGGCLAQVVP